MALRSALGINRCWSVRLTSSVWQLAGTASQILDYLPRATSYPTVYPDAGHRVCNLMVVWRSDCNGEFSRLALLLTRQNLSGFDEVEDA